MKLSVFYSHIQNAAKESGKSEEEILQEAKSEGISALDISFDDFDNIPIVSYREKLGIGIASVYGFYDWGNEDFGDDTRIKAHIDKAASAGCRSILVVPGFLNETNACKMNSLADVDEFMQECESIKKMTEMLCRAVRYGSEKGVTVTLEDFDNEKSPCSRIPCLVWFMKQVDGLRLTFDTGNFLFKGEDIVQGYKMLKNYIVHVHCKDRSSDINSSSVVGEGVIPLSPIIKDLKQRGYDGYFSIEHFGLGCQEKSILSSARNLKGFGRENLA